MNKLIILFFFSFASCTTFSKYSKNTKIQSCEEKKSLCVINDRLGLRYKTFGGFHFANTLKEYRKMKVRNKPNFKNIIVYGRSKILDGDYYLLLNNEKYSGNFQFRDTIINNQKITIALSKNINYKSNTDFLLNFNQNK